MPSATAASTAASTTVESAAAATATVTTTATAKATGGSGIAPSWLKLRCCWGSPLLGALGGPLLGVHGLPLLRITVGCTLSHGTIVPSAGRPGWRHWSSGCR